MPPEKNVITSNIVIMTRRLYNNLQFVDTTPPQFNLKPAKQSFNGII